MLYRQAQPEGNPDTCRGILEAAGFEEIELHSRDFDYFMGKDME